MIDGCKNSLIYRTLFLLSVLLIAITFNSNANYTSGHEFYNSLTAFQDTTPVKNPSDTIPRDSLTAKTDTFSLRLSKDTLDSPVEYRATDSVVIDLPSKKIILFSKANIKKDDLDLSADSIEIDQTTRLVTATFRRDSTGKMIGRPVMLQGDSKMESDVIRYNTQTQKGMTQNTISQQGEIFIQGEKIKKVSVAEYFAYRGQFTTCNLDTPHFAFRTKKLKLVNKKLAITGPVHPEFEGVPVPVYLPFGFFPIAQGRHSGFLPPQFTASDQYGLGLQGLGYYKVLSDYFDVTVRGDIYSYGGWAGYLSPTYRKRYRYSGAMNFTIQKTRLLSSDPKLEFDATKTFNITWSHTMDNRARPGTSFSANVNAGSTKFNRFVVNNPIRNYSNQLNSSITYSKTWGSLYNLTASANHSQNNNSGLVNLNLPTVAFTVNTLYPFQSKEFTGSPKWYEKFGIGLQSNVANQISFYDSLFSIRRLVDTMQWGAQHSVPLQLSLPPLGPLQVGPGISYQEKWYSRKFKREWNDPKNKVDTVIEKGFFTSRDISFSLGLSTALFGTLNFNENKRVKAIRHVIRPSLSFNYKPDLAAKDYYEVQLDSGTSRRHRFSYYEGSIFGGFSEGTFGGISFGIDNNVEMKLRSKTDTTDEGDKKIRLLDGFGINGSFNFMADSFRLSPLSMYLRSTLFEKINITAGGTLDPYQVDAEGYRVDQYTWNGGNFSPGRLTTGNIAISTTFQSKPKDEKKAAEAAALNEENGLRPMTMEDQLSQMQYVTQNPAEFADFNIPWSLSLSYSWSFYRDFRRDYKGFETRTNSNLSWNGDFNLTEKWKMGMQGYYDFNTSTIQTLTMYISREMHCWQLSINVTPVGLNRSFNITINPKSGILRDLRVNRTRYFYGS